MLVVGLRKINWPLNGVCLVFVWCSEIFRICVARSLAGLEIELNCNAKKNEGIERNGEVMVGHLRPGMGNWVLYVVSCAAFRA